MGSKLEALRLAEEFGVSMTPVRDSLNQLTGEGLVEFSPGDGFRVARLTEQGLRELLEVNHLLLVHAIGTGGAIGPSPPDAEPDKADHADRLGAVFRRIAAASGNRFLLRSVEQIGARLNPVRRLEPLVIPSSPERLHQLEESVSRSRSECIPALVAYHASCLEAVPRLIASIPGLV